MLETIDWTVWGIALLVGFPLLVVIIGEVAHHRAGDDDRDGFDVSLSILRNGLLPLAFIDIVLRKIVGYDGNHLAVKIADTALWIVALNAAVAIFNAVFFREGAQAPGKVQIPKLLLDLSRLFLVICGAAVVVSRVWNVDLSSMITALGVGSVVIGLALQDTLGSLFAGIALVSSRQFKVGDWIRYGNEEGLVLAMNWRSVKIQTRLGDALYLPNGIIARQPVKVLAGGTGSTVMVVELHFPYFVSPEAVVGAIVEAAHETPNFLLTPPPVPRIASLDDNGMKYVVGIRVADPQQLFVVRSEFLSNLWYVAQRRGVEFSAEYNRHFQYRRNKFKEAARRPEALVRHIASSGAFHLDPGKLRELARHGQLERYRSGQSIIRQGSLADRIHILIEGRARAQFADGGGKQIALHEFERGQILMAKAAFQGTPMPFGFKAMTESKVISIPVADFKAACAGDIALARDIEQILSAREDAASRELAKVAPDQAAAIGLGDRMQLMREMFRT